MNKHHAKRASAEFVAEPSGSLYEHSKKRLLAKVGLFAGLLASAAVASTARPVAASTRPDELGLARTSHPLEYVGITSNRIWVPNLQDARQAAQDIAATNAN